MKIKNIVMTLMFVMLLGGFALLNILTPDKKLSDSERRELEQLPVLNTQTVFDGSFFSKFEDYALDQFALRDEMRSIKAITKMYALMQKDNNGVYVVDDGIYKTEYPLNEAAIKAAAERFQLLVKKFFPEGHAFYSVIPDKNYFIADKNGYLTLDYKKLLSVMADGMGGIDYIDIFPLLALGDYYRTDLHWDGSKITDVADKLLSSMGSEQLASDRNFLSHTLEGFKGSYYGQAALSTIKTDTLTYLTDSIIDGATVSDLESGKDIPVVNPSKFGDVDPYDVFLNGPRAYLTIKNPANTSGKKLVLFRDSFGSSIAPLLMSGYSEITLVDLRYISVSALEMLGTLSPDADVLFLFNTVILNNSSMLIKN